MRRLLAAFSLVALAAGPLAQPARAQFTVLSSTAEIQEDWKVVVAQGDAAGDGPQIMVYMSPTSDETLGYAWFMLNVRDRPNAYTPGGLQIQVWDYADNLLGSATSTVDTAQLNTANETITWTQRIVVNSKTGTSSFEVFNGKSTTWGDFGSSQGLAAITLGGTVALSGYTPSASVKHSCVAWQPNNVSSMTLVAVRQYDSKGKLLRTDNVNLSVDLSAK